MNIDLYWKMDERSHQRFHEHLMKRKTVSPQSVEYYDWRTSRSDMLIAWGRAGTELSAQYNGKRDERQEHL